MRPLLWSVFSNEQQMAAEGVLAKLQELQGMALDKTHQEMLAMTLACAALLAVREKYCAENVPDDDTHPNAREELAGVFGGQCE